MFRDRGTISKPLSGARGRVSACSPTLLRWLALALSIGLLSPSRGGPRPDATVGPGGEDIPPFLGTCGVTCHQDTSCNQADMSCPGCDELGLNTCSDSTFVKYNPGGVVIYYSWLPTEPPCRPYRDVYDGPVICYRFQRCGEGAWTSFNLCTTGTFCTGTFPVPAFCQTCVLVGAPVNVNIGNVRCVEDSSCCENWEP